MPNKWMLDVLADLSASARKDGLGDLAERLEETRRFAEVALTKPGQGAQPGRGDPGSASGATGLSADLPQARTVADSASR